MFITGWRHALRSEWPFIIINIITRLCAAAGSRSHWHRRRQPVVQETGVGVWVCGHPAPGGEEAFRGNACEKRHKACRNGSGARSRRYDEPPGDNITCARSCIAAHTLHLSLPVTCHQHTRAHSWCVSCSTVPTVQKST